MKKILLILVALIGFGIMVNAQDIITLKNGTDINAFVQKIGDVEIEYKKFDNPNGPNYTLKKTEILMIRYENGTKDIFSEELCPLMQLLASATALFWIFIMNIRLDSLQKKFLFSTPPPLQGFRSISFFQDCFLSAQERILFI